ncbi:ComEC/Rec2 family competence protein [Candidatus Bipolaricaulota bacterium]|nr:ComEC/Rec2 family competence protein [Candidatus Bipolaricaulota bacterium]
MDRAIFPGLVLALALGSAMAGIVGRPDWCLPAALASLALALLRRSPPLLWLAAFFAGLLLWQPSPVPEATRAQIPLLREVTGSVKDIPEPHPETISFSVRPSGLDGDLLVYLRTGTPWQVGLGPGDLVRLSGEGELLDPGGWGEYLKRRGIVGLFWADGVEVLEQGRAGVLRWLGEVRGKLVARLHATVPEQGAELLAALLFGTRGLLPEEEKAAFRTAGVAHLLALSGLHLSILTATVWWLLGLMRLRPGARYLVLLPLSWGYVLLAGARISLVRAAIMLSVFGLFWLLWEWGLVLRRWYDPLQGLSVAALFVILIWPWSPLDTGFQLSFLATFSILYLWPGWGHSPLRARLSRPGRWIADILATSAFAQAGTLPIVGSTFGYISPYGLVANLLLIPWTGLILWAGLFLLIISPFSWAPSIGHFLHRVVVSPYLYAVEGLASLPGAALPVGEGFGLWCLCCALGILLLRAAQEEI